MNSSDSRSTPASSSTQDCLANNSNTIYDAIVVGAGATGGVAAKTLAEQGLTVLVLDAGPQLTARAALGNPVSNMAKRLQNLVVRRTQSFQALHPGYWKKNPDLFIDEQQNPYTTPEGKPFYWLRGRQVGGKSLTWGGITLRLSDYELQAARFDGYGENWPLTYSELAPYYDRLERFFQVRGGDEGLDVLPPGQYQPPAALTPAEEHLKTVLADNWPERSLIPSRGFSLDQPTAEDPWPRSSSLGSSLRAALQTGRVTIQPDAVVSHVCFDPNTRLARGVGFVHRVAKTSHEVRARAVVLCASTIESVRILLRSTEHDQPGGLVNASGLLGRHLMDHISAIRFFVLPEFKPLPRAAELSGSHSFFIPRFCNLGQQTESFLRGYGLWGGVQRVDVPELFQRHPGSIGFLVGHGEVLSRPENRIQLDSRVVDAWGISVPHIDSAWSDNEQLMLSHMHQQIEALVERSGGYCLAFTDLFRIPLIADFLSKFEQQMSFSSPPGFYVHEVGGARMGTSAQNSVVNSTSQCWETPNLLVTDGACWPSAGWQNPTLTEMAITMRACELLVKQVKQGAIASD
ncbi:MAG: GMC family oxidoreductase [Cyanobacteria bacterium P01_H01_bin.121]